MKPNPLASRLAACALAWAALAGAGSALAQAKEQFFPVLSLPHRRLRAQRRALR